MGIEAENLEPEEVETEEVITPEEVEEVEGDGEGQEEATQPQKTQAEIDAIVSKRVNRLNRKVEEVERETDSYKTENKLLEEKNKLLEMALQQKRETEKSGPPNPDDFDSGEYDDAYKKAAAEYNQKIIRETVAAEVAAANQRRQEEATKTSREAELRTKQRKHYERAMSLEINDFEATEDAVIAALGNEAVNFIIETLDDESAAVINRLGKTPAELTEIAGLIKSNPGKAVLQLGRISARIGLKSTSTPAPDPVDQLEGASPSASEAWIRKVDKMRQKVVEGKATMADLIALKKKGAKP